MRYLALDWGTVRVGAAVSDPGGKIAFPLDKYLDAKNAIDEIKKIIAELQIEKILVGLPKGLNSQDTDSTRAASEFIENLKNQVGPPIETLDERFSSVAAGHALTDQGISEKNRRNIKDNIAAQIILQQYLGTNNKK